MGEFMGRHLAHQDTAGGKQPGGRGRIVLWHMIHRGARMSGRGDAGRVVDILQSKRNAVQRATISAGGYLRLRMARRIQRPFAQQGHERVELRVERFDPR